MYSIDGYGVVSSSYSCVGVMYSTDGFGIMDGNTFDSANAEDDVDVERVVSMRTFDGPVSSTGCGAAKTTVVNEIAMIANVGFIFRCSGGLPQRQEHLLSGADRHRCTFSARQLKLLSNLAVSGDSPANASVIAATTLLARPTC